MTQKVKPWRSLNYRSWVKSLPCCVCRNPYGVDPHHENIPGHGSMGGKAPDDRCLPLCRKHHQFRHDFGKSAWKEWEVDPEEVIRKLKTAYKKGTGIVPGGS